MKLSRLFAIPALALLSAAAIESSTMPGGAESDQLERYKEGDLLPLKKNLRALAGQEDAARFSVLFALAGPK